MIKRHLLQPMIPGTIHPLHHQLSLHPRLDPYLLNPFHHALPLPMMDTTSIEKRIGNSSSNNIDVISRNNNDNNNRPSSTRPLRSFLIEDILKHSPKRSHVPPSETAVTGATTLSCDSPPLPPASIRNLNKHHRASSDRDSQDSIPSSTTNNRKSPKKEPESTSSTPSPKSSTTSSEYNNNNNNLTATSRESHKLLPDTKGKDPNLLCNPLSSLDGKDVVWPAWVYCTRYSDRPSSGMYYSYIHSFIPPYYYYYHFCTFFLFILPYHFIPHIIHHLIHHLVKFVFLLSSHPSFHPSTWDY